MLGAVPGSDAASAMLRKPRGSDSYELIEHPSGVKALATLIVALTTSLIAQVRHTRANEHLRTGTGGVESALWR